ncbi:MAG TPA: N-acetylmuramoyl-L-alanine amidase [Candidatus Dormibacteraeota bacterium]|nr:N-acetylmuramoyl-L-alanine amidase [Candidatus Dormibacteraeota bacterium]
MRRALIIACFLSAAGVCAALAAQNPQQAQPPPAQQTTAPGETIPPAQTTPAQIPGAQTPATPQAPAASAHVLRIVVLNPGHGGADTGARGSSGTAEKDLALEFARITSDVLRAQGFQVVLTRQGDTDPSFDDRAATANAQSDAIFISLHIGSIGPAGTVRTYTYLFPSAPAAATRGATAPGGTPSVNAAVQAAAPPPGFVPWREAQKPYEQQSRKLGDLLQVELAQKFKGSPEISSSVPVYELRSVAAPAVAVEISNIAIDPQQLEAMAPGLADAIARAVTAYKTIYPAEGK